MKSVTSIAGVKFEVDISDEACDKFGFKHGENIIVIASEENGVVVGVAPLPENVSAGCVSANTGVLWVRMEGSENVCFFPNPSTDFRKMRTVGDFQKFMLEEAGVKDINDIPSSILLSKFLQNLGNIGWENKTQSEDDTLDIDATAPISDDAWSTLEGEFRRILSTELNRLITNLRARIKTQEKYLKTWQENPEASQPQSSVPATIQSLVEQIEQMETELRGLLEKRENLKK